MTREIMESAADALVASALRCSGDDPAGAFEILTRAVVCFAARHSRSGHCSSMLGIAIDVLGAARVEAEKFETESKS